MQQHSYVHEYGPEAYTTILFLKKFNFSNSYLWLCHLHGLI